MTEFQVVARHWKRMCKKYWRSTTCHGCPIAENEKVYEACSGYDIDIGKMEELVMAWAAEHPEPVYPSYLEVFGWGHKKTWAEIKDILANPIPADIAQKLGIEPKEAEKWDE